MGRSRRLRWRQGRNLRHGALSMNRARSTLSALAIVATIAGASVAAVASTVALIDVRSTPPAPSPDVLSIPLQDEDTAPDLWEEAPSMGESVRLDRTRAVSGKRGLVLGQ